jgi:antitoxin component YwqK of YwqJK toxin-antitoxin module
LRDSFWYHEDCFTEAATVVGRYVLQNDSILILSKGDFHVVFKVKDSLPDRLELLSANGIKYFTKDSGFFNAFQRDESYYPDGSRKTWKKIMIVVRRGGILDKYRLYTYDEKGNITSSVMVREQLNSGKQFFYYMKPIGQGYVTHDNGAITYQTIYYNSRKKMGRWKHGRKVGKWKYYDQAGKVIKQESY